MHSANRVILSGHPCRMELCIRIGPDMCPFMWNTEMSFVYMFSMHLRKASLKP
jgi:hypothetical protein